jgi:hypothetical protein
MGVTDLVANGPTGLQPPSTSAEVTPGLVEGFLMAEQPLATQPKIERTWTRNDGARAPERKSQLDRIVMAMLRGATAYEAKKNDKTSQ